MEHLEISYSYELQINNKLVLKYNDELRNLFAVRNLKYREISSIHGLENKCRYAHMT